MVGIGFLTGVVPYFNRFRNDQSEKWVCAEELVTTVEAVQLAQEDGPVFVNWYSGRHYFDYPTLAFLLGDTRGANRTPLDQGYIEQPSLELTDGIDDDQLYVFIGDYADHLDELRSRFPDGRVIANQQHAPRVVAFEVPASP